MLDHVDFGDPTSEAQHVVAPASLPWQNLTGVEAGLTRRTTTSGGFLSARLTVPAHQAFVLRDRETFAGPGTRTFSVRVNGWLVAQESLTQTYSGPATG